MCCSVLWCVAVCFYKLLVEVYKVCHTLQARTLKSDSECGAKNNLECGAKNNLECGADHDRSVSCMQCVAAWCSVLQCAAVWC